MGQSKDLEHLTICFGPDTEDHIKRFIYLVCATKQFVPKLEHITASITYPVIELRNRVHIEGVLPILYYLNEIRPYPMTVTGVPGKDAALILLTQKVLNSDIPFASLQKCYTNKSPWTEGAKTPTLLDLAIIARDLNPQMSEAFEHFANFKLSDLFAEITDDEDETELAAGNMV